MRRTIYTDEHEQFRTLIRSLVQSEVVPHYPDWEAAGAVPKSFYRRLGELGVLGIRVPEEYGGAGVTDLRFSAVIAEELARAAVGFGGVRVHTDIVLPYLLDCASPDQLARYLPGFVSGETMTSIAITEPGTGSDMASIRTSARREGDTYVLNGAKTFITGGANSDLFLVVCRTSRAEGDRRGGLSILLVEADSPGFAVGRMLRKVGLHAQDTVELSFTDVAVPAANLLGEEGRAFEYLTGNLAQERLSIAFAACAAAEAAIEVTRRYVSERRVFGEPLSDFQNTKFVLADCHAETSAARALVDRCLASDADGDLTPVEAATAKLFCTEVQGRVVDRCVQLHGGYGYMVEYPIARLYADARVSRIYGGTSEVMRSVIAKAL
ncbi:acyl-CoA dehydrogenase family protein [Pseudonocardia ailaonensis]|uniref:Acyl-[acyl-carrier-protein] dehydrogenase MbtN n=1 Tax=Pseudonocardia ailaonensis TaxID=367279 RepID=A0ABN2NEJ1_9PSEU